MFEITLPESGEQFAIKSMTRSQIREHEQRTKDLAAGKLNITEYQDQVLAQMYPDITPEQIDAMAGADLAHIVRTTSEYSLLGPETLKNWLRSGDGTAQA